MIQTTKLIPTREVARILGVTPSAISRMVRRGELASEVQLDGKRGARLFDVDKVRAVAQSRKS